jgi:hypothetical protein
MVSPLKKVLQFAVVVAALLSAPSSAGAATATITNGPSISGDTGFSTLLKLHNAGKTISCTGSTFTGTVLSSSSGSVPPGFQVGLITPAFSGCAVVGGLGVGVTCLASPLSVTSTTAAGSTKGAIHSISCHIFVNATTACRFTLVGGVGATHFNAPSLLRTDANHQNLAMVNSTNGAGAACSVLPPNDSSVRFTNSAQGDAVYRDLPSNLTVNVS